jgi:hypothetical protein
MSMYTFSYRVHPVCGRFQVSVVSLLSVCGAKISDFVNLHYLLSFPPFLWSFSGVCGLSVVPKVPILTIYTSSYRFHPVCGRFQVSVVCLWCPKFKFCQFTLPPIVSTLSVVIFWWLWFVCGAQILNSVNLHFLLSFPPCLWSFSGVCGLFVVPKLQILSYSISFDSYLAVLSLSVVSVGVCVE